MFASTIRTTLIAIGCCVAHCQTVDKSLTFDVASIKPAPPPTAGPGGRMTFRGPSGGPGTKDPGRISYSYMSLKNLLMNAFDMKNYQITGPSWLDTERFDINATMPPETTKEQFRIMLQNLLTERFQMVAHRETKEMAMYELVVAKGGPKLKESEPVKPAEADADPAKMPAPPPFPMQPKMGPDGFPILPTPPGGRGGFSMMMMPGRAKMSGQQQSMQDLANFLTNQLSRPVTDATNLTAKYDFTLTFTPEAGSGMGMVVVGGAPAPPPPPGAQGGQPLDGSDAEVHPTIFGAVQSQLGLKLEPKKGNVQIVVVDKIEKVPTEN